ncbi:MAG: sugar phosphate isomerase/epimerase [Spirochaetes bacterium]|nr:sugar phosphate isomerase/epimerase [Spirochaetota bacterium]
MEKHIAISTAFLYNSSIEDTLNFIKNSGFDFIELAVVENLLDVDFNEIVNLLDNYRLKVQSIHAPFSYLYKKGWDNFNLSIERCIELAECVHSEYIVTHPPVVSRFKYSYAEYIQENKEYFDFLELNQRENLKILSENLSNWNNDEYWCYSGNLGLFTKTLREKKIPLTLDISHLAMGRYNIISIIEETSDITELVHFSDFSNNIEHLPIGYGTLDYDMIFSHLDRSKNIVLEMDFCTPQRKKYIDRKTDMKLEEILFQQNRILRSLNTDKSESKLILNGR